MSGNRCDYLSGAIKVNADAPADWQNAGELPFWRDPNNAAWGSNLCRILYHETIHFWQFLSSAYIANLVSSEWSRLLHYEETGEIEPPGELVATHSIRPKPGLFSASELVECWARFWDVLSRGPHKIIAEESIPVGDTTRLEAQFGKYISHTGEAFDTVMQVGEDCEIYGKPYRWLLEKLSGRSALAALIFPIIAHGAFSSPEPVKVFCLCAEKALESTDVKQMMSSRTSMINYDWLTSYGTVVEDVLIPVFNERRQVLFASGIEVVNNGVLQTHPIFREYPSRLMIKGFLDLYRPPPDPDYPAEFDKKYADALLHCARRNETMVLGLPGQPYYRLALGTMVPPPRIEFRNMTWFARRPKHLWEAAQAGKNTDASYKEISDHLVERVRRYNSAKKAVQVGLPANAFEA